MAETKKANEKQAEKRDVPGKEDRESMSRPWVIIDAHMHIESARCMPMPDLWKQLPVLGWKLVQTRRTKIENIDKILDYAILTSYDQLFAASMADIPIEIVTAGDVYRSTGYYTATKVGENNTFEIGKQFIEEQRTILEHFKTLPEYKGYHLSFPAIVLTIDMEYAHIDGYFGIKIYNGIYDIEKDSDMKKPLAYWYPYHGFFKQVRNTPDATDWQIREKNYSKELTDVPAVESFDKLGPTYFDVKSFIKAAKKKLGGVVVKYGNQNKAQLKFAPRLLPDEEAEKYENWKAQIEFTEQAVLTYPLKIIPLYHYDPRRWMSGDKNDPRGDKPFDQVSGSGLYLGFKIYTAQGYRPGDFQRLPNLATFYARCSTGRIPIMNHCTPNGANTFDRDEYYLFTHPCDNYEDNGLKDKYSRFSKRKYFNESFIAPKAWEPVLEKFPKLYLCLAHFGGNKKDDWQWGEDIINMMKKKEYANLYADISSSFADAEFRDHFKSLLAKYPILKSRIMFGTDWYMILMGLSGDMNYKKYCKDTKEFLDKIDPNLWARFTLVNPSRFYRLNEDDQLNRILKNIVKIRKESKEIKKLLDPLDEDTIKKLKKEVALIKQVTDIENRILEAEKKKNKNA